MVKSKRLKSIHYSVRVCHTDHIILCIAWCFDFKKNFLCNQKLIKYCTLSVGYILEIEAFAMQAMMLSV